MKGKSKELYGNQIIKKETILLAGEYAFGGMRCTRVMEGQNIYLIEQSPKKAINDSLKYIGSSLKGATESARFLLGVRKLCPIMVNPIRDICLFPVHSPDFEYNIWFNPEHILKVVPKGQHSIVYLSNGYFIEVDLKPPLLNSRIHNANQLRRLTHYNSLGNHHLCREPRKELLLTQEKNGRYNFHILEDEDISTVDYQ